MGERVATRLHARRDHLAQLPPRDVARRIDQRRHHEEGGAQAELLQDGERVRVVAGMPVVEGEAVEEAGQLLANVAGRNGTARGRARREQEGAQLLARERVRPVLGRVADRPRRCRQHEHGRDRGRPIEDRSLITGAGISGARKAKT